jgi:3D-(3,5/4)-trihydroxycyclohexane-1,2-dione acylhydrolase (decyclizing)
MSTHRLTTAQAVIAFLRSQYVERDGVEHAFFGGCFGIFGHGNVAGIGQALHQDPEFPYFQARNEQAMVHAAAAYAKMHNRTRALACTTSIGPGATNMVTAAAGATINRLPVLLLPGDIFARRNVAPVLQQLERADSQDVSVNDCFRPISRYWDRINRPDQLMTALPEAMRVLASPAETGAVTLCLPQDVQAEAWEFPSRLFAKRVTIIGRSRADAELTQRAAQWIRAAERPLLIAGGGVIYAEATEALAQLAQATGIPVAETQAGKGSLRWDHPSAVGAMGVTGTAAANALAETADLVIGVGTRYSDFTTASVTAFQHPSVRFININVAEFDAFKQGAIPLVADARVTLEELSEALAGHRVDPDYGDEVRRRASMWNEEVERIYGIRHGPPLSQAQVIGAVETAAGSDGVVVCAAGSLPGDLHKLWRCDNPKSYHLEYGYSCMGYEVAGGLGIKMAAPDREVFVMVGDGSYLMMSAEIVTAVAEGLKLIVVLLNNHGYASIGGLSEAVGSEGFGTRYRYRSETGKIDGERLPVDFLANAQSLGAHAVSATTHADLEAALSAAKQSDRTTVIVVDVDREHRVGGYGSWWDVPVAEVSTQEAVERARADYEMLVQRERHLR